LLGHNVDAVAHPFRVFRRAKLLTPEYLYQPVADLLAQYEVAAEINYHINEPPLHFIKLCLDRGVKFSLGSDAHNLYEVGEFSPHLQLLKDAGFDGDLRDIVLSL
jgi:putative hydrolase